MSSEARRLRAAALYGELLALGVGLRVEGERLELRAPRGRVGAELRGRLRELKPELIALLRERQGAGSGKLGPGAPLTGPQRQLWFAEQLATPTDADLAEPRALAPSEREVLIEIELLGPLDRGALERALAELVARHSSLRTRIETHAGVATQIADPPRPLRLDRRVPLDLSRGPLFAARLRELGPDRHELELRVHHVVFDGRSVQLLLDDLGRAYAGEALGPAPLDFAEIASAIALREAQPGFAARVEARARALGVVEPIDAGLGRERGALDGASAAHLRRPLAPSRWAELAAFARARELTPFMVLLAATALVLGRWTGRERLCFGVPSSQRDRLEYEGVIGMFVDTMLVPVALDGAPSFAALLERVRAASLAAFDDADLPLDRVIAALPDRGAGGRVPDTTFNFVPFGAPKLDLDRGRGAGPRAAVRASMPGARFDLTIYAIVRDETLWLEAALRRDAFEPAQVEALLAQIDAALAQGLDQPERSCASIELEPGRRAEAPPVAKIAGLAPLERLLAVDPGRTALSPSTGSGSGSTGSGSAIDYGQLRACVVALSERLRGAGVEAGELVAIHARREPALAVAILATWAVGASFAILDAGHPAGHLAALLEQLPARALLCVGPPPSPGLHAGRPALIEIAVEVEVETVVEVGSEVGAGDDGARELRDPPAEALAHVAFTSGTTGVARAVAASHEPLRHFLAWYGQDLEFGPDERVAVLAGLGHDPLLRDLLLPLCHGASCHFPAAEPGRLGAALGAWLRAEAITTIHPTPALARMIAATTRGTLLHLRRVCFGGDVVRGADVRRWRELAPNAALFNFYGATETPQAIAVHPLGPADLDAPIASIGRGIDGVELELVDALGRPAAIGELAEIVVRSRFLARGYLDDDDDASSRFGPGPRYRTGDLGRRRADGAVAFVGRRDGQVEIRGERVELAAVEAALASLDGVEEAAALARTGADGELELAAWLVGPGLDAAGLARALARLRERLPAAMIPSRVGLARALPRTRRGKLDRRLLQAATSRADGDWILAGLDEGPEGPGPAPRTTSERALAELWSELLGAREPRRDDDFFRLGGHSLLAVTLVARIASATGVELPVAAVFEGPILAELAAALDRERERGRPAIERLADAAPTRASLAQERMWLLERVEAHAPQLQIVHDLRGPEALELERLDAALVACEARHELLRARFELRGDALVVELGPGRASVLEPGPPPPGLRLDLRRGPLWRVFAWTEAPSGEARVCLILHHAVADAATMEVLASELAELYAAELERRPAALPELPLRYVDVAAWQRARLDEAPARAQLERWRAHLDGLAPLPLPLAVTRRPPRQGHRGRRVRRALSPATTGALGRAGARAGATTFMVALTALTAILARWTGSDDVSVGTPVGLRPHAAAASVVGPFLGLVTLRLDCKADPSLAELLARVRAETLVALARAEVPFEAVLRACDPPRELGRTPLFQVLFNVVESAATERSWAQLGLRRELARTPDARYDLAVYLLRRTEGDELVVVYDADLFVEAQAEQLLDHLELATAALASAPQLTLAQLELSRATAPLEPAPAPAPAPSCFIEGLLEVGARFGERPAVSWRGGEQSYAELLGGVRALASAIDRRRLGPRLGLIVERDADLAVGMLGVLASARAYVPLEPELPPARLRELAQDAQLATVVCSASQRERADSLARALGLAEPVVIGEASGPLAALPRLDPSTLAYLLYTSGSTGQPKAVMQSRANLARHGQSYARSVELGPTDRVSLLSTYAFDAAVMDIYGALGSGACLCVLERGPEAILALPSLVRAQAINVLHCTPTLMRELIAGLAASDEATLSGVRAVVLGGEEASLADARAIRRHMPGALIVNGLGPTECTLALQHRVPASAPLDGGASAGASLPIGRPVGGLRVHLRTPIGEQPALFGVGELVLEGPQVALGYWRRPQLSAERFPVVDGARCYRSGDLGRRLLDGALAFAGRRDGQLEVRGHRVEPGEIEARLRALAGVRDAAVVLRRGGARERLVAYYVGDASDDPQALLAALREQLPAWMVPTTMQRLAALPRTSTAKIDRRTLAARPLELEPGASARAPSSAQRRLLALWSEALGQPVERVDLDLFACGGDSLAAVRLIRLIEAEYGRELALASLFEGADVATLARALEGAPVASSGRRRARLTQLSSAATRGPTPAPGPAFVCVLPPGGGRRTLDALASVLDAPLWSLEAPSFGESGPLPELEELARACVEALVDSAAGPFVGGGEAPWIGGVSNGGLIALELARQLRARAIGLGGVFLLDSIPPELLAQAPWRERPIAARVAAFAADLCGPRLSAEPSPAADATLAFARARELLATNAVEAVPSVAELEAMFDHYDHHGERAWRVLSAIEVQPVGLTVDLFEAREPGRWPRPLAPLWRRMLGELRHHTVPGDHRSMLGPTHARALAGAMCRAAACAKL